MPTPVGTDRLETGAGGSVALSCACPKGWRPSVPGRFGRAEHPGTAVRWGDELFEVVAADPMPDGGIRYSLAPWRNDHAVRWLERYDAESEAARAGEREWRASAVRKRRLAIIFSPLLGHLPGPVQEELEREHGAPANAMTVISAAPLFVVGILGCFAGIARMAGGSLAPFPEPSLPLSVYLVLESALRIGLVVTQSRPAGSLPGTIAWTLWTAVRRSPRPPASPSSTASGSRRGGVPPPPP